MRLSNPYSFSSEVKTIFKSPIHEKDLGSNKVGSCQAREYCLINFVALEPLEALGKVLVFNYFALKSVVLAVCQIFLAITFTEKACKHLFTNIWTIIKSITVLPVILFSTILRLIRCLLGAILHPIFAVQRMSAAERKEANG